MSAYLKAKYLCNFYWINNMQEPHIFTTEYIECDGDDYKQMCIQIENVSYGFVKFDWHVIFNSNSHYIILFYLVFIATMFKILYVI